MIEQLDAIYAPSLLANAVTKSTSTSGGHFIQAEQSATVTQADISNLPAHHGQDPIAPLRKLLGELRELTTWDDDTPKPNALALWLAERVLEFASEADILPSRLRPSPDGGVILAFRKGELYGKIEIFNDGDAFAALSGFQGTPRVWPVTGQHRIREALLDIQQHLG